MVLTPRSHNLIHIRTYADLRPWLNGFGTGKFNLMFLTGQPGLGKSRQIPRRLSGQNYLLVEGHMTPLKMYAELHRHRDQPVVIDDEETFHAEPQKVRLMKCLCGAETSKRVTWGSTTKLLEEMDVPPSFTTSSKVAVVTNHLSAANPHVSALFDRGMVLSFDPSASEIHQQVMTWFDDRSILDFFARWLRVISVPSMRLYAKAAEMKAAGIDWQQVLSRQWKASKIWLIDNIQNDPKMDSEAKRLAAFAANSGGGRATYFRCLKKWNKYVGQDVRTSETSSAIAEIDSYSWQL